MGGTAVSAVGTRKLKFSMRFVCLAALCGAASATSGCVVTVVGASVYYNKYRNGVRHSIERISFDRSWATLELAMKELGYKVTHFKKRAGYATVRALAGPDKTIQIRLEPKPSDCTEFSVRVGAFGDAEISESILAEVRRRGVESAKLPVGFVLSAGGR
jgi:hypothetical protein